MTGSPPTWSFLTRHAQVLLCIARDPGIRLRDIGDRVGITERAVHRIVGELVEAGHVSRTRIGRRSHYAVDRHRPLPDRLAREKSIGDLLAVLTLRMPANGPAGSGRLMALPGRAGGAGL